MRPTFLGFEVARKAINANQKGLDVVTQNITNANTEGYTRQKVDLSSISPDYGTYLFSDINNNVGQGVNVDGVSQLRNQFLDLKYRKENSVNNTWNSTLSGLKDVENVIDEVTSDGLSVRFADFYQKLQSLSLNTTSVEFSTLLRSSAQKITQVLNKNAQQLNDISDWQKTELTANVEEVNSLLFRISDINSKIKIASVSGNTPNELLDTRNTYLDKLSGFVNITVENQADNTVAIKSGSTYLIDVNQQINNLSVSSGTPISLKNNDGSDFVPTEGSMVGHLQLLNGRGIFGNPDVEFQGIQYYQMSLDNLAKQFADTFNNLNTLNGVPKPLFSGDSMGNITASTIGITSEWLQDSMYLTSTTVMPIEPGKNDNVLLMIKAMNESVSFTSGFKGTFEEYVTSLNFDIANDVRFYEDISDSSNTVLSVISDERDSISGVSVDEEAINMIKYQKAYTAAARLTTMLDETLDIIINRMGIVGR